MKIKKKKSKALSFQVRDVNNPSSYTKLYRDLIFSNSFKNISADAKILYVYMNDWAFGSKNYYDEKEFEYSLGMVQSIMNVSLPTAVKLIKELIENGLLERTNNSRYSKHISKFKFSDKWKYEQIAKLI